jgi:hypothetical protein
VPTLLASFSGVPLTVMPASGAPLTRMSNSWSTSRIVLSLRPLPLRSVNWTSMYLFRLRSEETTLPPLSGLARSAVGSRPVAGVPFEPVGVGALGTGRPMPPRIENPVTLKLCIRNPVSGLIENSAVPLIANTSVPATLTFTDVPTMPMSSVPFGWRVMTTVPLMSSRSPTLNWSVPWKAKVPGATFVAVSPPAVSVCGVPVVLIFRLTVPDRVSPSRPISATVPLTKIAY